MAVSDWQPRDHCCEEKRCHLPSSTLALRQIFFLKSPSGPGCWHAGRKAGNLPNGCNCVMPLLLGNCEVLKKKIGWYLGTFCSQRLITPGSVFACTNKSHHRRRDSKRPCLSLPEVTNVCLRSGRWRSAPFSQSTQFTDQTIDRQAS